MERRSRLFISGINDCSGDDIPRSIIANLNRMGHLIDEDSFKKYTLTGDQVLEWDLPPAPTKMSDTRSKNWDGLGQVELDAVEPNKLKRMTADWISELFDDDLHDELMELEEEERTEYQERLKEWVVNYSE